MSILDIERLSKNDARKEIFCLFSTEKHTNIFHDDSIITDIISSLECGAIQQKNVCPILLNFKKSLLNCVIDDAELFGSLGDGAELNHKRSLEDKLRYINVEKNTNVLVHTIIIALTKRITKILVDDSIRLILESKDNIVIAPASQHLSGLVLSNNTMFVTDVSQTIECVENQVSQIVKYHTIIILNSLLEYLEKRNISLNSSLSPLQEILIKYIISSYYIDDKFTLEFDSKMKKMEILLDTLNEFQFLHFLNAYDLSVVAFSKKIDPLVKVANEEMRNLVKPAEELSALSHSYYDLVGMELTNQFH